MIKAYELMKLAAENQDKYKGKRFKVVGYTAITMRGEETKEIEFTSNGQMGCNNGKVAYISSDTELEEIKPSVTFNDAMNSGKSSKMKGDYSYRSPKFWMDCLSKMNIEQQLIMLNGQWFLED